MENLIRPSGRLYVSGVCEREKNDDNDDVDHGFVAIGSNKKRELDAYTM